MDKEALTVDQLATLTDYAAGRLGTRRAIEQLGMRDFADLVIALARSASNPPTP